MSETEKMNRTHAFVPSGITAGNTGIELCKVCGASERASIHERKAKEQA